MKKLLPIMKDLEREAVECRKSLVELSRKLREFKWEWEKESGCLRLAECLTATIVLLDVSEEHLYELEEQLSWEIDMNCENIISG